MKSFRSAVVILTTLMLAIAAATTAASAQIYTDLYNFDGTHGANPTGILAQGRDGNLYGTTQYGGKSGHSYGTVFGITPTGTERVLYNFSSERLSDPMGGLTLGTDGNFYGTTQLYCGTIFKISKSGNMTVLYYFEDNREAGCFPQAPPIEGTDGNFFGTTMGNGKFSPATAYKITPSGALTFVNLPGSSLGPLLQGTDGNFYGTTSDGGANGGGTVFKISPRGALTILYNFCSQSSCTDGSYPSGGLVQATDGNFYGATELGGLNQYGTVFKITPAGTLTTLHSFLGGIDGWEPYGGLVQATDGNLYGTTANGGTSGAGVIFQITLGDVYSVLYTFDGTHGAEPWGALMQHTNGKIYGTTWTGGPENQGVVYSFDMGLGPFVSFVLPAGKVGKTVEILGQGFTGTTGVSFNGMAANFKVVNDTFLEAAVPGDATTGFVTVNTPTGTLTSNVPFRVMP
jgi:uncharacterized repeat protein (TIGR03803 family)